MGSVGLYLCHRGSFNGVVRKCLTWLHGLHGLHELHGLHGLKGYMGFCQAFEEVRI